MQSVAGNPLQRFTANLEQFEKSGGRKGHLKMTRDKQGNITVRFKSSWSIVLWMQNTFTKRSIKRDFSQQVQSYLSANTDIHDRLVKDINSGVIPFIKAKVSTTFRHPVSHSGGHEIPTNASTPHEYKEDSRLAVRLDVRKMCESGSFKEVTNKLLNTSINRIKETLRHLEEVKARLEKDSDNYFLKKERDEAISDLKESFSMTPQAKKELDHIRATLGKRFGLDAIMDKGKTGPEFHTRYKLLEEYCQLTPPPEAEK